MRLLAIAAVVCLLPGSASRAAQDPPPTRLGQKVADFTLKDTAGQAVSLHGFKDRKAVVVIFIGTECPISNAFMPRLAELHKKYAPRGVQFLAVNSNEQDTAKQVSDHARKHGLPFPVCKDQGSKVADLFAARRTPEAFVLDAGRTVRYAGRIDDQFGFRYNRPRPTRRDLALAVEEVLAGQAVAQPALPVAGCHIARAATPKTEGAVTYSKQVARILQKNCQECHRPGQIGPMPLLKYESARDWSATIHEVIEQKRMPPWNADPRYGKFSNDRHLSKADRDTLLAWIDDGCPTGDDKDLPPARQFAESWRIGKPDMVFATGRRVTVPAKAANGIRYQYFVVPTNFKEDRWVQAAEARPGNRAVVHHIIVYVRTQEQGMRQDKEDKLGDGFLVGYAPGDMPAVFAPGTAKKVPKGAYLVFQMHYTPNGVKQTDESSVGLVFAKEPPRHELRTRAVLQHRFAIPPGDSSYRVVSESTFHQDTLVLNFVPHMHLRGKDFEYRVVYPDGKQETLLSVPRWDFNWQSNYRLAKPLRLPAGSRIECTAHYDNSADNPNNPDPTRTVHWGDQTWDEMMIGFVDYVYLDRHARK